MSARLLELDIEDFGLIARARLEFANGFTVCSGETGSGKTMLLGALGFALGERSSSDIVRGGATRAKVTLALEIDAAWRALLAADGIDVPSDDGEEMLVLARDLTAAGKSTARINGRIATVGELRAIGEHVLEAVGQHEAQHLLDRKYQIEVVDRFAGDSVLALRREVARAHARAREASDALATLRGSVERAREAEAAARYARDEIDAVAPVRGEDTALRERRDYLANAERIRAGLATAHDALGEGGALETLGSAASALAGIARFAPELDALAQTVAALQSETGAAAALLAGRLEEIDADPNELEVVTARLDAIEGLKKKYGADIDAVLAARTRFAAIVEHEAQRDERERELEDAATFARETLVARSRELSALRTAAARDFETRVAAELVDLAMPAARFQVAFETLAEIGPNGAEAAEFLLAPNPGEPLRALGRAASGGELSRVLLALVVVLADRRERTALVFDEIDAGIGGATASAVGMRVGAIARTTQVLCVTHLAQIATWADRHYALRKRTDGATTIVEIVELADGKPMLEEIARMLSGNASDVALRHAQTLVRDVRAMKSRFAPA